MKETDELLSFIRNCMTLNYETGELRWRSRSSVLLKDRQWNGRFAGKLVGTLRKDGYLRTGFNFGTGVQYILLHRIVWAITTGSWPSYDLDHRNQVKSDNRISNLRLSSRPENIANRTQKNSTGYKGVRFDARYGTYQARIMHKGKAIHLLSTKDIKLAAEAYDRAAVQYYGEFADTNFQRST